MAEGQLIVRWAQSLAPLAEEPLELVSVPRRWHERARDLPGQQITQITTHGKHLLIHLSGGMTIHCHALMYGYWQFGKPGMTLERTERNVRLRLRTANHEAVFYNGPVVELLTEEELMAHERLSALGPDLLHDDFDRDEAWRRAQSYPDRPIGDLILDQTVMAGVGNIYKSEGLFAAGIDPRKPTGQIPKDLFEELCDGLISIMRKNIPGTGEIVTLPFGVDGRGERYWVYRRRTKPCLKCGEPIQMVRQGEYKRTTYFCPSCQKEPARPTSSIGSSCE
jgi:DNA-formamidopyrimidine glycosylase